MSKAPAHLGSRICARCKRERPIDAFRPRKRRDGRLSTCDQCLAHRDLSFRLVHRRIDARVRPWETVPCPEGYKVCTICLQAMPIDSFSPSGDKLQSRCKQCRSAVQYATYDAEGAHWRYIERRYGITQEDYDRMFMAYDGACPICGTRKATNRDHRYTLVVDHDHETGKVRGLICHKCNVGLGHFGHNPALLRKAAEYLGAL